MFKSLNKVKWIVKAAFLLVVQSRSRVWLFVTPEPQHARPPCSSLSPGVYSNSCPLSQWCHPTISPSVIPSPPAFSLSQHQGLFQWVSCSHQVAKVLEFQLQYQSFQWIFRVDFQSCFTQYIKILQLKL